MRDPHKSLHTCVKSFFLPRCDYRICVVSGTLICIDYLRIMSKYGRQLSFPPTQQVYVSEKYLTRRIGSNTIGKLMRNLHEF